MDGAFEIGARSGLKGGYKMKKFLSIALAIVCIMGMRPLTANACEGKDYEYDREVCFIDEVIMPRVALCRCGGVGRYVNDSHTVAGGPCPENSRYAHHGTTYKGILMFCQECNTFSRSGSRSKAVRCSIVTTTRADRASRHITCGTT